MNTDKHRSEGAGCLRMGVGTRRLWEALPDAGALEGKGRLDHRWTRIRKAGAQPWCGILGGMNTENSSWVGVGTGLERRAAKARCHLSPTLSASQQGTGRCLRTGVSTRGTIGEDLERLVVTTRLDVACALECSGAMDLVDIVDRMDERLRLDRGTQRHERAREGTDRHDISSVFFFATTDVLADCHQGEFYPQMDRWDFLYGMRGKGKTARRDHRPRVRDRCTQMGLGTAFIVGGACARVPLRKTKSCAGHGAPRGGRGWQTTRNHSQPLGVFLFFVFADGHDYGDGEIWTGLTGLTG
ncbi:MAG: hypothetical protein JWR26_132 [Pedosphaera sp.]|nr:hypothetical protein [Pedosphaera sp.]